MEDSVALRLAELREELIFSFDTKEYDFISVLRKIFGLDQAGDEGGESEASASERLSRVHTLVEGSTAANYVSFENDQATWFHRRYYQSPHLPELLDVYERFIREVIVPRFFAGETRVIYQKKPTFRVHLPNNVAVGQKHRDGDYFHPPGEINFWLPFTAVHDSNGFYVETQPDKGDFHGLTMGYGQVFRFWGNRCWHYNLPNTTGRTRLSFDFRLIAGSCYSEPTDIAACSVKTGLKFRIGSYFGVVEQSTQGLLQNGREESEES
ncbi:Streptomycin biosynthesis protein StrG [Balamuthia mandrillaris]